MVLMPGRPTSLRTRTGILLSVPACGRSSTYPASRKRQLTRPRSRTPAAVRPRRRRREVEREERADDRHREQHGADRVEARAKQRDDRRRPEYGRDDRVHDPARLERLLQLLVDRVLRRRATSLADHGRDEGEDAERELQHRDDGERTPEHHAAYDEYQPEPELGRCSCASNSVATVSSTSA